MNPKRDVHCRFMGDEKWCAGFHAGGPELRPAAERVTRPEYSMSYIRSGRGFFEDARCTGRAFGPGTVIQRFPDRWYTIRRFDDDSHAEFFVTLPARLYEGLAASGVVPLEHAVLDVGDDDLLRDRAERFAARFKTAGDSAVGELAMEALELVFVFVRRASFGARQTEDRRMIERACRLLRASPGESVSIREIARRLGVGYESFRKKFARSLGISPARYRRRARLESAVHMLLNRRLPICEIAHRLGYADVYAFTKQFARTVGQPPARFRQGFDRR